MPKRKHIFGQHHLARRRGKNKFWTGWLNGREVSLGTADRVEAQRKLDELAARRASEDPAAERGGAETRAPAPNPPLLSELAMLYAEHCRPPRHTKKTANSYAHRVAFFVEAMEKKNITRADQVTFKVMSAYVRERSADVSAATVNRDLTPIRRMFAFAKREGHIEKNPFKHEDFEELKLREPRPKPNALALSPKQVDIFLAKADEMAKPGYAALFRLTAGSAIRIDEARHYEPGNIDVQRGILTITPKKNWTTKGYRYRDIPVSKNTIDALLAFVGVRDKIALDDKAVWNEIQRVRQAARLPKFSIHDLRRAWASAMHKNGASIKQVSVWLGHCAVQVTERYIRIFETDSTGHEFLPR
ncbi:tyrosine-type recombinase/integrase [Sorangium sp. So ce204]|uniref:tyrosine-type recombinase/integrase n=1 Tax=unclassified Sorangium TaxID=2621164 RepID=UPI003F5E01D0